MRPAHRSHRTKTSRLAFFLALAALASLPACYLVDRDADGAWRRWREPRDCDDEEPTVHPAAVDIPLNGIDENCDGRDAYRDANVLFLLIDALRPDFLSTYAETESGRQIQLLSDQSVTYRDVIAQSSCTKPSMPSMLTSLLPSKLYPQIFNRSTRHVPLNLPAGVLTLPELLRKHGYVTAAFATNPLLRERWGSRRGFAHYQFIEPRCKGAEHYGSASDVRSAAIDWLQEHARSGEAPFFLYLHFMDVHTRPCHFEYASQAGPNLLQRRYAERVSYVDDEVGRILRSLDELELTERTIVVLTADHGEELADHGGSRHCQTLFEESIRIPLIIRVPRWKPTEIERPVRGLDILPTLLRFLEVPFEDDRIDGIVLPPFGADQAMRPMIAEQPRQVALLEGDWKLIYVFDVEEASRRQYGGEQVLLFDLTNDPEERVNLRHEYPEVVRRMRGRIAEIHGAKTGGKGVELSAQEEETLRALGYIE